MAWTPTEIAAIAAAAGAVLGYIARLIEVRIAAMKQHDDSDAQRYTAALNGYKELCADLQERIDALSARVVQNEAQITALRIENLALREEVSALKIRMRELGVEGKDGHIPS